MGTRRRIDIPYPDELERALKRLLRACEDLPARDATDGLYRAMGYARYVLQPTKMAPHFAVFNCHVNRARTRADAAVKQRFGDAAYHRYIQPCHADGIMTIFEAVRPGKKYREYWVRAVTRFVNEGRR